MEGRSAPEYPRSELRGLVRAKQFEAGWPLSRNEILGCPVELERTYGITGFPVVARRPTSLPHISQLCARGVPSINLVLLMLPEVVRRK